MMAVISVIGKLNQEGRGNYANKASPQDVTLKQIDMEEVAR